MKYFVLKEKQWGSISSPTLVSYGSHGGISLAGISSIIGLGNGSGAGIFMLLIYLKLFKILNVNFVTCN
jgi:hypothetical protein